MNQATDDGNLFRVDNILERKLDKNEFLVLGAGVPQRNVGTISALNNPLQRIPSGLTYQLALQVLIQGIQFGDRA